MTHSQVITQLTCTIPEAARRDHQHGIFSIHSTEKTQMASYRKTLSRKKSKRSFKRSAGKAHKLNKPKMLKRGGHRL